MRRWQDVFTTYGSGSINSDQPDVELGLAQEAAKSNELTALLANKRQAYSGPDGAVAAFNNAMHKNIIKALEGDYSQPLSGLDLVKQIWSEKGFTAQLATSAVLGALTAFFYVNPALEAAEFLGNNINYLTIFLKVFFVSAGPGLNCALGCLSIKKLIDVFRNELSDEEAFLRGKINLSAFEKLIDNAKDISDVVFAVFATFAPVLLGTVGIARIVDQIAGGISGVTNVGPNWLGMNSINYPTLRKVVPLRKAQLIEAQYLNEQLRLLSEFPIDDLLAKIYLIRDEICHKEGNKLSEQDYLKLFLHLLQLGKKVDVERKGILLEKYPLTYFASPKKNSLPESQPLLDEGSSLSSASPNSEKNNKKEKEHATANPVENSDDPDREPIDILPKSLSSKQNEKSSSSAAAPATVIYQNPSTKMKIAAKYLLGIVSAISPLGYVLETKNGINDLINEHFHTNLAWPGFIAAAGALLPYLGLGLGAGLGVGEGLTTDGKKLAEIVYPKIYNCLKWAIVILGLGSGGTNAEANYQNFPKGMTPPPTTPPGTTPPAGSNNSTADFDSQYPSTSQILRYIAGGWGIAACPITNIYYTLELMEELIVYIARNCSNPEARIMIESMLSISNIIKLRQQTSLPHYQSILEKAVAEDYEISPDISKILRGIFADRLSPNDYYNRDNKNSVGMLIPELRPTLGERFESQPKKIYTESPCQTFFSNDQLRGNELRRRKLEPPAPNPGEPENAAAPSSSFVSCNVM